MPHVESCMPQRSPRPLRLRRLVLGLTQAELAGRAALSREQVIRLEAGSCSPTWRTALALADALDCDPTTIFPSDQAHAGGSEAPPLASTTIARRAEDQW